MSTDKNTTNLTTDLTALPPIDWAHMTIPTPDDASATAARERQNQLLKPFGSLGKLEEIAIRLCAIQRTATPSLPKRRVCVFAADNGIWDEGITPVPQSVTAMQANNMLRGIAGIAVLTRNAGCEVEVIDVGVKDGIPHPALIRARLMPGTHDIARGPAMTRDTCERAIAIGFARAAQAAADGISVLGIGEMGICNTATSAAVLSALTGVAVRETVGRGAGITEEQLERKRAVVREALDVNAPNAADPIDVLHKVGGLDIAAMTGCFLGAAAHGMPVLIDGYISIVAALAATRLRPDALPYLFATHRSAEPGYIIAARELALAPLLDLDMRLGEGTGCPLAMQIMDQACHVHTQMGTFAESAMDASEFVDLRER